MRATGAGGPGIWLTDAGRRTAVVIALNPIPFAGIAFLWFIGVIRDRIGGREDRFFATVFLVHAARCFSRRIARARARELPSDRPCRA